MNNYNQAVKRMLHWFSIVGVVTFVGCASLPPEIADLGKNDEAELYDALKSAHSLSSIYIGWRNRGSKEDYISGLREKAFQIHPEWSDQMKAHIRSGKVAKRMEKNQVLLSIGYPIDKELWVYDGTENETWTYEDTENVRQYIETYELEFKDGLLDSWVEYRPQEYPNITVGYERGNHDLNEIRIN